MRTWFADEGLVYNTYVRKFKGNGDPCTCKNNENNHPRSKINADEQR